VRVFIRETTVTRKHDPFILALESLRARAEDGVFAPGRPVVIAEEARRLRLSTTPVREALAWLSGYGLIERAPTGGYLAPRLDPAAVRDRFAFRLHCLTISVNGAAQDHRPERALNGSQIRDRPLAAQMLRAVKGTGNAALVDAYERVCSQLIQLAPAERRLFRDFDEEAARIAGLFEAAPGSGLRDALAAYHQRRMDAAPLLILEADARRDPPRPAG
jgi:DNA-binding GntR family transcriptional regulator